MQQTKYFDLWIEGKRVGWGAHSDGPSVLRLLRYGKLPCPISVPPSQRYWTSFEVQAENKITTSPSKVVKPVKKVCRKKTLPSKNWGPQHPPLWPFSLVSPTDLSYEALHEQAVLIFFQIITDINAVEGSFNNFVYLWKFGGTLGWGLTYHFPIKINKNIFLGEQLSLSNRAFRGN